MTLSTNVDGEMKEWVQERAVSAGMTPTEFVRRLLDLYQASTLDQVECPGCGEPVRLERGVEQ